MMDLALTGALPLVTSLMVTEDLYFLASVTKTDAGRACRPVAFTMVVCLETMMISPLSLLSGVQFGLSQPRTVS